MAYLQAGAASEKVLLYAYLNAFYETGFTNPIDEAIRAHRQFDLSGYRKAAEIPYDFLRKRLSILIAHDDTHLICHCTGPIPSATRHPGRRIGRSEESPPPGLWRTA